MNENNRTEERLKNNKRFQEKYGMYPLWFQKVISSSFTMVVMGVLMSSVGMLAMKFIPTFRILNNLYFVGLVCLAMTPAAEVNLLELYHKRDEETNVDGFKESFTVILIANLIIIANGLICIGTIFYWLSSIGL